MIKCKVNELDHYINRLKLEYFVERIIDASLVHYEKINNNFEMSYKGEVLVAANIEIEINDGNIEHFAYIKKYF